MINKYLLSAYVPGTILKAVNLAISEMKKILSWHTYSTGEGRKIESKIDK